MVQLVPNMSLVKIECLLDYTHDYTKSVNDWFKDNKGAKNALMIIGGLMSDIVTLATLGMWTWKGKTWRLPIALVFIYVSKAITSVSNACLVPNFLSTRRPYSCTGTRTATCGRTRASTRSRHRTAPQTTCISRSTSACST